ncbi:MULTISPECIES: amino acid ABC transporter substrate-binding protein [unclassified Variovorax]|uniref:amino acid ABC transporter substrate-binding protein n=1 Tax=unclassified Variovorax TaxID=663243 RepID=UPI00164DB58A|nr:MULTISPECIES: amino acid ABC transporter substrate-binding protein [unclassified Variovorax]MEB0058461.1 amino acid ABC transporter substrate-binding protein [Variovorax sp. LG9.2]QNK72686.1 ABC transporter substrate-binding protein [Variovorax sp. PAMC28562]
MQFDRRTFLSALAALGVPGLAGITGPAHAQAPTGAPIKIGGTLALTGPLSATAMIHKLVGEMYIEELNRRGGLLGRPVEWVLKDDQSKPDLARTLYEQLVTADKVDLLIGPYATGSILSAMGVAQRYNKTLVHHTFGVPSLAKYEQQFPAWAMGPDPQTTVPTLVLDALAASPKPPKTIAILTSKFPSVQFVSYGAREVAKKRGLQEVLFLEWDFGNRDFGPIAGRVKEANPDFVWNGALGLEGNQMLDAMKKIDYHPPSHFYLYPAPGPMMKAAEGNGALTVTIFEDQAPFTNNPVAAAFARNFRERATKANLPDTGAETQAASSYAAWQIIEAGVVATKSLDDKAIATWIKGNQIDTIEGKLRFNERGNFGADLSKLKQVQDGRWVTVWPADWAAAGIKLRNA